MSRNLKKVDHGKTLDALSHTILGKITTPAYLMQEETVTLGHRKGRREDLHWIPSYNRSFNFNEILSWR